MKASVERFYPGHWDDDRVRATLEHPVGRARVVEVGGNIAAFFYPTLTKDSERVLVG